MAMVIIGPAIVWLVGGWLAITGAVTIGTIVTFVMYLARLYGPASSLAGVQVQIVSAFAVFERIFEYLDMEPEGAVKTEGTASAATAPRTTAEVLHDCARRDRLRRRALRLHARAHGARRHLLPRPAGPDGGVRRTVGRGQDDDHAARPALLRSAGGRDSRRRPRHPRRHARIAARERRDRHAGDVPLPRHDQGESALRAPGRDAKPK